MFFCLNNAKINEQCFSIINENIVMVTKKKNKKLKNQSVACAHRAFSHFIKMGSCGSLTSHIMGKEAESGAGLVQVFILLWQHLINVRFGGPYA